MEMHSRTLRRASPGLSGLDALLMAFSTSSSMAFVNENATRYLIRPLLAKVKITVSKESQLTQSGILPQVGTR